MTRALAYPPFCMLTGTRRHYRRRAQILVIGVIAWLAVLPMDVSAR